MRHIYCKAYNKKNYNTTTITATLLYKKAD